MVRVSVSKPENITTMGLYQIHPETKLILLLSFRNTMDLSLMWRQEMSYSRYWKIRAWLAFTRLIQELLKLGQSAVPISIVSTISCPIVSKVLQLLRMASKEPMFLDRLLRTWEQSAALLMILKRQETTSILRLYHRISRCLSQIPRWILLRCFKDRN